MTSVSTDPSPPPTSTPRDPNPSTTTKPFRFKRKRPRSASHSSTHPSKHHRHHHRSHRNPPTPPNDRDPFAPHSLDPDIAFRESLFDALADDEGAAFWEGVYGQPIHTYTPYTKDPGGELERMTDEEYVSYVRGKMWEKSHGYLVEERIRRDEERKRRKVKEMEEEKWQRDIEESLARGRERKKKGGWRGRWEGYLRAWNESVNPENGDMDEKKGGKQHIVWPVEHGRLGDVHRDGEVEKFFREGTKAAGVELEAVLKRERVRWHPDKMTQRLRGDKGGDMDAETMKAITAVFQVVDRLWGVLRAKDAK